jgi:hypothetical protein
MNDTAGYWLNVDYFFNKHPSKTARSTFHSRMRRLNVYKR